MKVGAVEAFPISIKAEEKLTGGTFSYTHYQTVLVKVTSDGVDGWGEAMTRFDPGAAALLVKDFGSRLVGGEFSDPRGAWGAVWRDLRVRGHTRGTDVEALSGIEIALYDCYGKLANKPLNRILSGTPRSEVTAFAGSLMSSRAPLKEQTEKAQSLGLSGAKVKVGFGVERDTEVLREVRRLWPDGMLVADANGAYDGESAVRACASFRGLDLGWFEEPVLSDDLEGYRKLKGSGVTIGAGESWFPGDFQVPVEEGLVGVLEPSVSRCGGVAAAASVAALAAGKGLGFSPMTGMNSAVSVAASAHVATAFPSVGVEYNPFPNPLQTHLAEGLPALKGGKLRPSSAPGLGLVIDEAFVKRSA